MSNTLYATFNDPGDAEKAAGALLDHGVRAEDISVVRREGEGFSRETMPHATATNVSPDDRVGRNTSVDAIQATGLSAPTPAMGMNSSVAADTPTDGSIYGAKTDEDDANDIAKRGITTTTAGDAGAGAVAGTVVGAGIGAVAILASMVVPGVGIVLGAGALATAIGGIAASAGAGAAAGALVGYLKDMGVDDQVASDYNETVQGGGAIVSVSVPSGDVSEEEARSILSKYAATNVNGYASRGYVA